MIYIRVAVVCFILYSYLYLYACRWCVFSTVFEFCSLNVCCWYLCFASRCSREEASVGGRGGVSWGVMACHGVSWGVWTRCPWVVMGWEGRGGDLGMAAWRAYGWLAPFKATSRRSESP